MTMLSKHDRGRSQVAGLEVGPLGPDGSVLLSVVAQALL
jgi:hypothetical protein